MRDVLLFTSHLGGGGAEKQLVRLANHLDRQKFRVRVAVMRGEGTYETELVADVPLEILGAKHPWNAVWPLRRLLAQHKPALLFSLMDHANCVALVAAQGLPFNVKVVAGIQNTTSIVLANAPAYAAMVLRRLIPALYPRADSIVALSAGVRDDLVAWIPKLGPRVTVIHNAGADAQMRALAQGPVHVPPHVRVGPVIIAAGRLTEQKGFDDLLVAFAKVRERLPAKLWLLGEGPLGTALARQARTLGIYDAVWFAGFQSNPFAYMRAADVFVLSSLWEGFANVVVEAMAVGTPVIATDCPHGPAEILRGRECGLLVPQEDPAALATGLLTLLEDSALRKRFSQGGLLRAQDFEATVIAKAYGDLFMSLMEAN